MNVQVDLSALAGERGSPQTARSRSRVARATVSRYVVPAVILGGFTGIFGWSVRSSFLPVKDVTVTPVVASRAEFAAAETPAFQAAGWVEPRPQPVVVTALTEGIIEEMLVVEGQQLEAGQVVARLIRKDAQIEVQRAEADVKLRQAEREAARAGLTAAEAVLEEPLPRLAELAAAEAELTRVETEIARMPTLIRSAEAKRTFARQQLESKSRSGDAVAPIQLQRAKSDLDGAAALVDEYQQQQKLLENQRKALAKRRDVLQRQLDLKIEENRRVAEAEAEAAACEARLQQAQAVLDAARLKLERTEVRASVPGRVLALLARPGARLMGLDRAALVDASSVITMYDPTSLQVRADVRLEDVPQVAVGQKVRIATPASAEPLSGRVLVATALTDIQKNTLQVKIAIDDPPPVLKPDMLVQATFLAAPRPLTGEGSAAVRLLIPRQLIEGPPDAASVWIADQSTSTARRRRITVGAGSADDLAEVTTGLNVGDRVIVEGREFLTEGARIRVVRDAERHGQEASPSGSASSGAIRSNQIRRNGGQD